MKGKKILSAIIAGAMVLGTMSFPAFAANSTGVEYNGITYDSFIEAREAVESDATEITFTIHGKVVLPDGYIMNITGDALNAETVNFKAADGDETAELALEGTGANIIGLDMTGTVKTVNYEKLILSRANGGWIGDIGHANNYFTTAMRGVADGVVNYINCTFPNGSCNNFYSETVYTDCKFNNDTEYGLWIYGGKTEVTGATFTGAKGVQAYSEDANADVITKITDSTFNGITNKPAFISGTKGTVTLENITTIDCEYGLLQTKPKDGNSSLPCASVTIDGEEPAYVAKVGSSLYTDQSFAEKEAQEKGTTATPVVAKVNGQFYTTLADAIAAAEDGDTINVLPVTVDGNSQPVVIDKKVKFDGIPGSEIKNTKFVIKAPVEFNGLKITGDSYIDISDVSATDLSVTNCDVDVNLTERITGKAAFIFATSENHSVKITLKNNNIIANSTNLAYYPAAMFTWANLANESEISNNIFGDDDNRYTFVALKSLNADDGAVITLSNNTVYGTNELWCDFYAFDFCQNNSRSNKYTVLSKNNIVNALPADSNFSVNAFCIESNGQGNATLYDNGTVLNGEPINLNNIGTIQSQAYINVGVNVLLDDDGKIISGVFLNPVPSENMASGYSYKIINGVYVVNDAAGKITVKLVPTEDENVYDIVLDGNGQHIYEFVSAELQFVNNSKTLSDTPMSYEIAGTENINVIANTENEGRYGFYLKDGAEANRMTGTLLTIGQVVFPSQGSIDFGVTAEESTVIATLKGTHLETTYTLGGGYELEAGDPISSNIAAATRNVAINVDFAHTLDNTGWNGDHQITVTLKDAFGNIVGETAHPLAIADNAGTYTFEDVAVGRITVTLKAPGFRTYTYTTTVEEGTTPLVLTFWNDTKRDAEKAVEIGGRTMSNNFVVGDIAMDYIVDKYDLAAVTSYYGTYNLTDESKIKYDLNRDGNIDITDVAYVLHNFGF